MKKRRLKLVITVLILMAAALSIYMYIEAKRHMVEEEKDISWYEFSLLFFELGAHYERLDDGSIETIFYPTDYTQEKVDRWKLAAEVLPVIEYPEDLILENDWIEVFNVLETHLIAYESYYESKDEKEQETLVKDEDIEVFIGSNYVSDNLQQAFDEAGIDYE
jgi:hypothetical protein